MEEAVKNVPIIPGQVYCAIDTSGSMGTSVSGQNSYGRNSPPPSKIRCVDAAGLIAAAVLRKNPMAKVLPFSTKVHDIELSPMNGILENAAKFVSLGGGGTACSEPLRVLNALNAQGNTVIYVSDYESWADSSPSGTVMMSEWKKFKHRNKDAKLICIDLVPRTNKQTVDDPDILNVGGFSDAVFSVISEFVQGRLGPQHWVGLIKEVQL